MLCAMLLLTSQRPPGTYLHKVGVTGTGDLTVWKSWGFSIVQYKWRLTTEFWLVLDDLENIPEAWFCSGLGVLSQ